MLEVRNLSKRFSRKAPPALVDVSFTVQKGEICGLLGHNGAGKSTAIGSMLGLVYPDQGEVLIGGCSVQKNREKAMRKIGAIFEAPSFYEYLTGWKNLKVLTAFSENVPNNRIEEVVEWVGLKDRIHHRVGTYSHGMRQRLGLAQALLPQPEFLLLDEPTDGLDPEGIVEFREQILNLRKELNLTVLLSSHLLTEVDQVCDKVVILRKGQKVYDGNGDLSDDRNRFKIVAENADSEKLLNITKTYQSAPIASGGISFPNEVSGPEILRFLVEEQKIDVSEFTPLTESLEDLYLDISQESST